MIKIFMKSKIRIWILVLFFIVATGFLYSYYEAHNIQLVKYSLESEDLPESFSGKKIVFISDIHCDEYFGRESFRCLVERINGLNPDIILLGGDYVSSSDYIDVFLDEVVALKSRYGVFSVLGNHDHWSDVGRIKSGMIDAGIKVCDNSSSWVKIDSDSIKIGGVGDWWCDTQMLDNTISDVAKTDFCILLSHQPSYIDDLNTGKVDLMLSGHTHGGQVTFFGLWAPLMPGQLSSGLETTKQEYRYGWKEKNDTRMYVSSGVGMGGFPFRFFARPEIVEIVLQKKNSY